ncbi:MAG: N-6 DNA methylase [Desulfobacteraceae bacterium]|nr:N-6 DNA methylase [Desulfobacteraceae bacterium]MBC2720950.1 N-6 DNA methylase [Desulfobacteraceae bacterium]
MDKISAISLIRDTLENPFDKRKFACLVSNMLDHIEAAPFIYRGNFIPDAYKPYIRTLERIGKYEDREGNRIDLLIVQLKKETSLERARTMQRNFIAWYLNGSRGDILKDAALAAFVSPDSEDWRFSIVKMDYRLDTSGEKVKVKKEFTPARRWSFLVGTNEKSHTAQSQLVSILANDKHDPTLKEIEQAFDIETVTKEFFLKYRELFLHTKEELDKIVTQPSSLRNEFEAKGVDTVNFAKKLLGQIIFLYFLQKKGWFGVGRDDDWGTGSKHFLRELFGKTHGDYNNFFNDILEPLFYDALRNDRSHDDGYYSRFNCKIPFLNGGLFDPIGNYDWVHIDIIIPDKLFSNNVKTKEGDKGTGILDVFDRYNFTVKEDEPLEKEVAIDPELLGKSYEKFNAIRPDNYAEFKKALKSGKKGEENKFNKKFGVYYTPREIVHYMCQQSLINYLDTAVNTHKESIITKPAVQKKIFGPQSPVQQTLTLDSYKPIIPKKDIEKLIHTGEQFSENEAIFLEKEQKIKKGEQKTTSIKSILPDSIRKNAKLIDDKLAEITVCDPAVGSGAFPVGMMSEIVKARNVLSVFLNDKNRKTYDFKRRCIEHSLYGVDIDPGAVEIAKLRLWLSLVVDEDDIKNIKPLPNLDYKIVCGNSLLGVEKNLFNFNLFNELEKLKPLFFNETNPTKKQEYKKQIDELIRAITNGHTEFDFEVYFSEVFHKKGGFDVVIGNPPYFNLSNVDKEIVGYLKKKYKKIHTGYNDIVYYFIYLSLKQLSSNGISALITSNYYLGNEYAQKLRVELVPHVSKVLNFKEHQVFSEASVHTCITFLQARPTNDTVHFYESGNDHTDSSAMLEAVLRHVSIQRTQLNEKWLIAGDNDNALIEKLHKRALLLRNIAEIEKGSTSGRNTVFTLQGEVAEKLKIERPLLRRNLKNSDIERYFLHNRQSWLIYTNNEIQIEQFPNAHAYLILHESELSARNEVKKGLYPWYRFERPRKKHIFDASEKIVVPYRAPSNRFAYDNEQYFNDGGDIRAIVITDKRFSCKYVLALLNSTLLDWFYGFIGKPKGDAREYFNKPLALIPVKLPPTTKDRFDIEERVEKILAMKKENPKANVSAIETEIDQLIYKLYDLTPEEIKIVEGEKSK